MHAYMNRPTHIHVDIRTFVCVCVYARSNIKSHTNIHSYVHARTHARTYKHTHI